MKLTYVKRGQYWYKVGNTKHPYERRNCTVCGKRHSARRDKPGLYCSKRCAQMGENNTRWKGEDVGYFGAHGRVYRTRGTATMCIFGDHSGPYDWANLLGDYPDTADYTQMCRACHAAFDGAVAKCLPHLCGNGLHMLDSNADFHVKIRNGKEYRSCKRCDNDRSKKHRRGL